MTSPLRTRTEVLKLARVLRTDPARLAALEPAGAEDVRRLREQIADALFEADRARFERSVALAGYLPAAITAQLAQHVLGAPLGARAAALLDPQRAADLASRLSSDFLADVAVSLDTRKIARLLGTLPADLVADVAAELGRREEWIAMGAIVSHLSPLALDAALAVLDDGALLQTAFMVEEPGHLAEVLDHLSDERLAAIAGIALAAGLSPQLLELVASTGAEHRERLKRALAAMRDGAGSAVRTDAA
jgi:hypothetical protein